MKEEVEIIVADAQIETIGEATYTWLIEPGGKLEQNNYHGTAEGIITSSKKEYKDYAIKMNTETLEIEGIENIKGIKPTVKITTDLNLESEEKVGNVKLTLEAEEYINGLESVTLTYKNTSGETKVILEKTTELETKYKKEQQVTENGEYTLKAKAKTTGEETSQTITINQIDDTIPEITIKQEPTNPEIDEENGAYAKEITLTITAKGTQINQIEKIEDQSGNELTIIQGSGEYEKIAQTTIQENAKYTFTIYYGAEKTITKEYEITNIDKDGPKIGVTPNTTAENVEEVTLTIIAQDKAGIKGIYIVKDGSNTKLTTSTQTTYKITQNGTYTFMAEDKLGNQKTIEATINNILTITTANAPKLSQGMIPVKWNGTNWVVCLETDPEWYNYVDQASGTDQTSYWANIMLMDELATTNYTNTQIKAWQSTKTNSEIIGILAGKTVTTLGSMYVWIPRYAYAITSGYHSSTVGTIKIAFLEGTNTYNKGDQITYSYQGAKGAATLTNASGQGNWNEHPAFNYGGTTLPGIWVAKFAASSKEGNSNSTSGDNVTTKKIRVVPDVSSWRYITVSNIFTNCININSSTNASYYGISSSDNVIDPHMMKNMEWGCVAYLTQSSYGRNGNEITINNSSGYYTGRAGDSVSTTTTSTNGTYKYNEAGGVKASTTGNISGIYDMSGGSNEYVAGYLSSTESTNGTTLINAYDRYKDKYTTYSASIYGDAVYETSNSSSGQTSWNSDYSYFVSSDTPFSRRGSNYGHGANAGVFCFGSYRGASSEYDSFRPVLVVLST